MYVDRILCNNDVQEISFNYAEEMDEEIVPKQYFQLHFGVGLPSIYRQCMHHTI